MGIADLFRPKHRHSNASVRAEAVRQLSEDEAQLIIDIARRDSDPSVRRIAIEKLDDPRVLVELARDEDDRSLRELASSRAASVWVTRAAEADTVASASPALDGLVELGDQRAIAEVASRATSLDVRDAALGNLDDDKALAELARSSSTHMAARATAVSRISDTEVLRSIAIDEQRKDVATMALERIDDLDMLESIVQKAKNKAVRTRARKRLGNLRDDAPSADLLAERRKSAERTQLLRRAEKLAQVEEWDESAREMEQIARDFEALGPSGDASIDARFERASKRYHNRLAAYRARQGEAEARRAKEEAAAKRAREEAEAEAERAGQEAGGGDAARDGSEGADEGASAEGAEGAAEAADEGSAEASIEGSPEASAEEEERQARERERAERRRERREQALVQLVEVTEEMRTSIPTLANVKAADKLLRRADKILDAAHLGDSSDERVSAFNDARQELVVKAHELREAEGWQQWANISQQEALIAQAQALLADEDRTDLGNRLKALQSAWKAVGPAPRKKGQELWEQFKAICDQIYEHVKVERARRSEVLEENLAQKAVLCERAEALSESTDWDKTAAELKDLQREWKAIGPVPRKKSDAIWKRFRGACDLFFERRKPHMEELMAEYQANLEKKQALCEQAEALSERAETLSEAEDWKETSNALRDLQKEWRGVGLVPKKDASAINKRFRAACDQFFERRKEHQERLKREHEESLETLGQELGAIATDLESGEGEISALVERTMEARKQMRELGPEGDHPLHEQASGVFRAMLEAHIERFKGTELDPGASRIKKQKLLIKAEELAPRQRQSSAEEGEISTEDMAAKLRAALAENAMASALAKSTDGRNLADTVAELRDSWRVIGPVPGAEGDELETRFQDACERALRSAGMQE